MDCCYSVDHIAEDHIHKNTTCNTEEPQQKNRIGTVRNWLLAGFNMFLFKPSALPSAVFRNIWSA